VLIFGPSDRHANDRISFSNALDCSSPQPRAPHPWLNDTTMTTSSSGSPFPHPTLTPIVGKPTAPALKQLRKEICANALSLCSNRRGGLNGHLDTAMTMAVHVIHAGQQFNKPAHPARPQPAHALDSTSAAVITTVNRQCDRLLNDFKTFTSGT
jgi:hypothetical protein